MRLSNIIKWSLRYVWHIWHVRGNLLYVQINIFKDGDLVINLCSRVKWFCFPITQSNLFVGFVLLENKADNIKCTIVRQCLEAIIISVTVCFCFTIHSINYMAWGLSKSYYFSNTEIIQYSFQQQFPLNLILLSYSYLFEWNLLINSTRTLWKCFYTESLVQCLEKPTSPPKTCFFVFILIVYCYSTWVVLVFLSVWHEATKRFFVC